MSRHPDVQAIVDALVGTWSGHGSGGYPTIDPFEYREETSFREHPDHPGLVYEQRTWRTASEGDVVSHWETGLLRFSSNGVASLNNAQPGRAETMAGTWEKNGDSWIITLRSTGYAGDGRVVASTRRARLDHDELTYQMRMMTTATNAVSLHLKAELRRHNP